MAVKNKYQVTEPAIASFDFEDIAEGTGVISFEAFKTTDSTGTDEHLASETTDIYSTLIEEGGAPVITTSFTKEFDVDYDLTQFNLPKDIQGTGVIRFSFYLERLGGGGTVDAYIIARIRKWDGTTETEVASVQTATTQVGAAANTTTNVLMNITIPRTHYKKGDTLRLTMEGWMKGSVADDNRFFWGVDPQNRDGTYLRPSGDASGNETTRLIIKIPFAIDL